MKADRKWWNDGRYETEIFFKNNIQHHQTKVYIQFYFGFIGRSIKEISADRSMGGIDSRTLITQKETK